ncbi:MAG: GGDEF domain-containing protein [Hydrogenothermus sp.]|nr:MAG: GGDEF domain-containing protein [Hydrogenothermus sp.]
MERGGIRCKLKDLENKKLSDISQEEFKEVLNVVRQEISFLIRNNIPPLPKWYERWFLIFCYLHEEKKNLSDLEIKGLYKQFFEELEENKFLTKNIQEKLDNIAKQVDNTLKEAIHQIENYDKNIERSSKNIEKTSKEILSDSIMPQIKEILGELHKIREQNEKLRYKMSEYHEEIQQLREELSVAKTEAEIDFLTAIPNRRRFMRALEDFLKDFREKGYIFSLIILDIDDFKNINDTYGHLAGDEVLKDIASVLKFYLRANTIVGRIGGEEFAILLPGIDIEKAKSIAERIRKVIENRKVHVGDIVINPKASFGVTQVKEGDTLETIINRADIALYRAKSKGKNRVEVEV